VFFVWFIFSKSSSISKVKTLPSEELAHQPVENLTLLKNFNVSFGKTTKPKPQKINIFSLVVYYI